MAVSTPLTLSLGLNLRVQDVLCGGSGSPFAAGVRVGRGKKKAHNVPLAGGIQRSRLSVHIYPHPALWGVRQRLDHPNCGRVEGTGGRPRGYIALSPPGRLKPAPSRRACPRCFGRPRLHGGLGPRRQWTVPPRGGSNVPQRVPGGDTPWVPPHRPTKVDQVRLGRLFGEAGIGRHLSVVIASRCQPRGRRARGRRRRPGGGSAVQPPSHTCGHYHSKDHHKEDT